MAITLAEQHTLAINGDFINRVRQAMATQALAVMSENTANAAEFTARLNLARRVLNDPQGVAQKAAFILVTAEALNETDPTAIGDNAYLQFVAAQWSKLAGYNPNYQEPA